ncbi:tRNA guanosine(34) transglycosylase Tgt [Helicobacter sp. 23-1044]
MTFSLQAADGNARAGEMTLAHSIVQTPAFMPVGTQGCVKALDFSDLHALGAKIILANTYHLYLRPSAEVVRNLGGLHKFSGFSGSFLTDSGGFQAFSLKGKAQSEGIAFKSHIDGSAHFFTPKKVLDIQYALNSDIMMILDDLIALPASKKRIAESIARTLSWAKTSLLYHAKMRDLHPTNHIFAIIQGGTDANAREFCAKELVAMECENARFDGFAIGGLAVGEEKSAMYDTIALTTDFMPKDKVRYLMGVGTPQDLLEGISRGVDIFDCVMPTRNARNGTLFTRSGRINIKSMRFKNSDFALDSACECYVCKNFSLGYLNHLFRAGEVLYARLASIHNLAFYLGLMRGAREAILQGRFEIFKKERLEEMR